MLQHMSMWAKCATKTKEELFTRKNNHWIMRFVIDNKQMVMWNMFTNKYLNPTYVDENEKLLLRKNYEKNQWIRVH